MNTKSFISDDSGVENAVYGILMIAIVVMVALLIAALVLSQGGQVQVLASSPKASMTGVLTGGASPSMLVNHESGDPLQVGQMILNMYDDDGRLLGTVDIGTLSPAVTPAQLSPGMQTSAIPLAFGNPQQGVEIYRQGGQLADQAADRFYRDGREMTVTGDETAVADAFTRCFCRIVVLAGLAISAVVLGWPGQQGMAIAGQTEGVGDAGMEKGLYAFYYTVDVSGDLSSSRPDRVLPATISAPAPIPAYRLTGQASLEMPLHPAAWPSGGVRVRPRAGRLHIPAGEHRRLMAMGGRLSGRGEPWRAPFGHGL